MSSVANKRFLSDSCTKPAVLSFFCKEGSAAFFGGEAYVWIVRDEHQKRHKVRLTGVLRYVCFGGSLGKYVGRLRNVAGTAGMTGVSFSSSDDNMSGRGLGAEGGIKVGMLMASAREGEDASRMHENRRTHLSFSSSHSL